MNERLFIEIVGKDLSAQAFGSFARNAEDAIRRVGGTTASYERITKNVEKSLHQMFAAVEKGGAASTAAVAKAEQQHALLRMEIERLGRVHGQIAPELIAHYNSIGAAINRTRGFVSDIRGTSAGTTAAVSSMGRGVESVALGIGRQFLGIGASIFTVSTAITAVSAGIENASGLRDLSLQMEAIEGGADKAAASLDYLNDAQARTRRTGDDLAKVYGELLPLALSKGFSREHFREVVVMLDQVATRTGELPAEINEAFAAIMSGSARNSNPILRALGLDADAVKTGEVSAEQLLAKMRQLAKEGEEMGDDFAASSAKTKDAIADAFSTGWNDAETTTDAAMDHIIGRLTGDTFLSAIRGVGDALRHTLTGLGILATDPVGVAKALLQSGGNPFTTGMYYGANRTAEQHPPPPSSIAPWAVAAQPAKPGEPWWLSASSGANVPPDVSTWLMGGGKAPAPAAKPATAMERWLLSGAAPPSASNPDFISNEELERRKKAAEEERKLAEEIAKRVEAYRFGLELIEASGPLLKAEVEYRKALAAAEREQTKELKDLARQTAEANYHAAQSAIFAQNTLHGFGQTPGVTQYGPDAPPSGYIDPFFGEEVREAVEVGKIEDAATDRQIEKWRAAYESFGSRVTSVIADIAITGGENFGTFAAQRFTQLVEEGSSSIFAAIFGTPGDPNKKDATGAAQVPGELYDVYGRLMSPEAKRRATIASGAMDFGMIGAGAYGGALAADGSRTAGLVSGAMGGMALGPSVAAGASALGMGAMGALAATGWGAVIGVIVAGIAGALGEKERQDNYKYFVPKISDKGIASLGSVDNIERLEEEEITSQIQDTYETFRNTYIKILLKSGADLIPAIEAIDGKFQKEGSAHTLKHFRQWLTGELPEIIFDDLKPALVGAFGKVGVSAKQFAGYESEFSRLDPKKSAGLWTELFAAMSAITAATEIFGKSYGSAYMGERHDMNRSAADVLRTDYFDKIMDLSSGLDVLVGEDRIHTLTEIGQLQTAGAEAYKAALREIVVLIEQARDRSRATKDNIRLLGMRKEDGSPDYEAQGEYLRKRLEREFAEIENSKTGAEASKNQQEALEIINQIVGLGYNINTATGQAYGQWALNQIAELDNTFETTMTDLGTDLVDAGNDFAADWKIVQAGIMTAGGDLGTSLVDIGEEIDRVVPVIHRFGQAIADATPSNAAKFNPYSVRTSEVGANYSSGETAASSSVSDLQGPRLIVAAIDRNSLYIAQQINRLEPLLDAIEENTRELADGIDSGDHFSDATARSRSAA